MCGGGPSAPAKVYSEARMKEIEKAAREKAKADRLKELDAEEVDRIEDVADRNEGAKEADEKASARQRSVLLAIENEEEENKKKNNKKTVLGSY